MQEKVANATVVGRFVVSLSCGVLFVGVALFFLLCQVCGVTRFVILSRQISRATERKHLLRVQEVRV